MSDIETVTYDLAITIPKHYPYVLLTILLLNTELILVAMSSIKQRGKNFKEDKQLNVD